MSGIAAKKPAEADRFSKLLDEGAQAGSAKAAAKAAKSSARFSFKDFILGLLDIINPLQHIPVVSTIYRRITGDEISPLAKVAGDALYGGPIGAAAGLIDVAVEKKTGKDIGENVMAMIKGDKKPAAKTALAAAAPKQDEIIWDDDMQQAAMKLTVYPRREEGQAPARDQMLKQKMNAPAAQRAQPQKNGLASSAANALLQAQEVPRDQVAQKMLEGLDKYRAMQGRGTAF